MVDEQARLRPHMRFFVNGLGVRDLGHALQPDDRGHRAGAERRLRRLGRASVEGVTPGRPTGERDSWSSPRLPSDRVRHFRMVDIRATLATLLRMQSVGIKTQKNRLSEYVRGAAAGETVLVTDRGQVVAELVSPRVRADASPAERLLGDLLRQGLLAPAKVPPKARLPRRKPVAKIEEVLRDLDDSRAER